MIAKITFLLGLVFSVTPWASPPLALPIGLAFGLLFEHPFVAISRRECDRDLTEGK